MCSLDPTPSTLVSTTVRDRIRDGRCAGPVDLDPEALYVRFQTEPLATDPRTARRHVAELSVGRDAAIGVDVGVEGCPDWLFERLSAEVDQRAEHARDLAEASEEVVDHLDYLRDYLAVAKSGRRAEGARFRAHPPRRRPEEIGCGARGRRSRGRANRRRGSRRSTSRSSSGDGDGAGGDGPGEARLALQPVAVTA